MPGDSGVTCTLVCALTTTIAHETAGASGARHSLRPQFGEGGNKCKPREKSIRRDREVMSLRHCEEHLRRSNPHLLCGAMDCFACARNDVARRDRELMRGDLPSFHAPLRVAGRGRGWGVLQQTRCKNESANLPRPPPPPPPPRRFAGGGEMFATARLF